MNAPFHFFFQPARGPAGVLLIRLAVGLIFLTQGILKYIDPNMGVVRFTKIGFPHPYFTAHFVGTFEIVCGARAAAVRVLIVIAPPLQLQRSPNDSGETRGSGTW